MASLRWLCRFFNSSNRACSSGVRSRFGFFSSLSFSAYSSFVKPCLLTSISPDLGMALVFPMMPFRFLKSAKSMSVSLSNSSLYNAPSSNPHCTTFSIWAFLSCPIILFTSYSFICEPSMDMIGQKFRKSPKILRSSSVTFPALAETLATSANIRKVRSGAKSKAKHCSFIRPL